MYPTPSSPGSRKRAAPGASPIVPIPMPPMQQQQYTPAPQDQMLRWNGAGGGSPLDDGSVFGGSGTFNTNMNPYMLSASPAGQFAAGIPAPSTSSTALARRGNVSRALIPTAAPRSQGFDSSSEWNFADDLSQQQSLPANMDDHESVEALEERALRAKKEALNKRKQIPPFVQKLSSFLEEAKNTELIRWSDSGDSFIVLDEDEFAKKLIPELFKHNNYASFVRQLNMYGFHKRVGLSDNSMKASERKNKSPSEYYNPYFKRGHPNLLWLINKPKSGNKLNKTKQAGKKDGEDGDSDEDVVTEDTFVQNVHQPPYPTAMNNQLGNRVHAPMDIGPLPKKELVQVKNQLDQLQKQQHNISQLLERLTRDHNAMMKQAMNFQAMHAKHENSINAILNFLANLFRKSLEEQGGASVQELLASFIPGAAGSGGPQMHNHKGNVVDLGDFLQQAGGGQRESSVSTVVSPPKRQPRLLPPIPVQSGRTSTLASPASTNSSVPHGAPGGYQVPQMGSVEELFDTGPSSEPTTPAYIKNELHNNPREGMMKIINDTNATGGASGLDLPDMASKTSATMSHEQRDQMLNIMAGEGQVPVTSAPVPSPRPSTAIPTSLNTLSPVLSSMPPPNIEEMQSTQAEMDRLRQMQHDQAAKIDELQSLLEPLSPMRHVPGLDDHGVSNSYFTNVDIEQFLDPNIFAETTYQDLQGGGAGVGTDGNDFNFDLDGGGHDGVADWGSGGIGLAAYEAGRIFDAGDEDNTPSPAGTEEILRTDMSPPDSKRRRMQ